MKKKEIKNAENKGIKYDAEKSLAGCISEFGLSLQEVAKVFTFGAKKYTRNSWQNLENGEIRYHDALWRHLLEEAYNENDHESGLLVEAHTAWNALARLELKLRRQKNNKKDLTS